QMGQAYLYQPNTRTKTGIELFFQAVEYHHETWIFFVVVRCRVSIRLRAGIERAILFFSNDVMHEMELMQAFQHIQSWLDLQALAQMLIDLSLNWDMGWIHLQHQADPELRHTLSNVFKTQSVLQMQLLLRGILHWHRIPAKTADPSISTETSTPPI